MIPHTRRTGKAIRMTNAEAVFIVFTLMSAMSVSAIMIGVAGLYLRAEWQMKKAAIERYKRR